MAVDPDKPFNREEMYLAKAAGEGTTVPDEPWSRKEAYLDKISGRMDGIDEKIAALATDISLKGGVDSYADLPEDAEIGDAYITEDTGILYVWVGDEWTPLNMQGGGGVKVLTADDYDFPDASPDGVALWRLSNGLYIKDNKNVKVYANNSTGAGTSAARVNSMMRSSTVYLITFDSTDTSRTTIRGIGTVSDYDSVIKMFAASNLVMTYKSNGNHHSVVNSTRFLIGQDVIDSLTSTEAARPLSANQGKVLNDKFGGMQLVQLTQAEYDALATKDPNTLYIIKAA